MDWHLPTNSFSPLNELPEWTPRQVPVCMLRYWEKWSVLEPYGRGCVAIGFHRWESEYWLQAPMTTLGPELLWRPTANVRVGAVSDVVAFRSLGVCGTRYAQRGHQRSQRRYPSHFPRCRPDYSSK